MSGLPRTRKRAKQSAGRIGLGKPLAKCQCYTNSGKECTNTTDKGQLFCPNHKNCPIAPRSRAEPNYDPGRYNNDEAI